MTLLACIAQASTIEEPGAEKLHAVDSRDCAGVSGNRRPYRGAFKMSTDLTITWMLALVPLSISPGPANVLFAASGSAFGIKSTVPFWLGTNTTCIFQTLAVGIGLGVFVNAYPHVSAVTKYIGVAFLVYLAFKFFRLSINNREAIHPLRFVDGVVVELLNVKYLMIPTIMFSQVHNVGEIELSTVIVFTVALALLTMGSNLVWVVGGSRLTAFAKKARVERSQGAVFGVMLLVTALWIAIG